MHKHIREAIHRAGLPQSTPVRLTNGGHVRIDVMGRPVFAAATPSCSRALHNITAELRRAVHTTKGMQ